MAYDVTPIANTTFGIIGTGIALSTLAMTSKMVMKTMDVKPYKHKKTKGKLNLPNYWMK